MLRKAARWRSTSLTAFRSISQADQRGLVIPIGKFEIRSHCLARLCCSRESRNYPLRALRCKQRLPWLTSPSAPRSADYPAIVSGEVTWPNGKLEIYIQPHPVIRRMNFTDTMVALDNIRHSSVMSANFSLRQSPTRPPRRQVGS
jgi:hypothetical protein